MAHGGDGVKERLKSVPRQPGVYLFKNEQGKVIYVGKAKALRSRMRSYFQSPSRLSPKVKALMSKVRDFDYIVTSNEVEALILECNFIKAHQPRYNIVLRDDKSYPYLKITLGEDYPRLLITREKKDKISRYFGPYSDVGALRETVRLLTGIFPVRTCRRMKTGARPCLNRHIDRCLAPCTGQVDVEEYRSMVERIIRFLEGDQGHLVRDLEEEMKEAARQMEYEKAARLRDTIHAIERVAEKQKVVLDAPLYLDVVAFAPAHREVLALVFKVRAGKVVAKDTFWLRAAMDEEQAEVLTSIIKQYYSDNPDLPWEILVPLEPADKGVLEDWLTEMNKARTRIKVPRRGTKHQLLVMAAENARLLAEERTRGGEAGLAVMQKLARALSLEVVPTRIECYDISHLAGEGTVGSMVVFTEGKEDRSAYRRFKLGQDMNNDYLAMAEVLRRRIVRAQAEDPAFLPTPDLIVVDGGLGQVNTAYQVLTELDVDVPVFGLAEKNEELFCPGASQPVRLPRNSDELYLLQRVRDEAHRFAINYQRQQRTRKLKESELDQIKGIGEKRKQALLHHFGSVARVRQATFEELCQVNGINQSVARQVYEFFHPNESD